MAVAIREPALLPDEEIKKYAGRWVAIKDGRVIKDAVDPGIVERWVREQGIEPDIVRHLPMEGEPEVWAL